MKKLAIKSFVVAAMAALAFWLPAPATASAPFFGCDGCGYGSAAECTPENIQAACEWGGICGENDERCPGGGAIYCCA